MPARALNVLVTVDSAQAERSFARLGASANAAGKGMNTASARMVASGKKLESFGKGWTKYVSAPIAALGAVSAKAAIDFNQQMELIATQAGGTQKEVNRLSKSVLAFAQSGKTQAGPQDLAKALFHIESVGFRGAKAMRVLKSSADLAAVGQSDLESTTYALVSALNTGIKGTQNMHKTIGTLNAIVGAGDLRMEQLSQALSSGVLVSAKQAGISLKDVGAALDTMTARGIPAEQAATRLRMTFTLMAAPTSKAKAALATIGINSTDLAKRMQGPGGLLSALDFLHKHLENLSKVQQTQVLSEAFGGARSGTTIMALVQNLDDVHSRLQSIDKAAGDFNEKLKEEQASPAFQLKAAWASIQASLVQIGGVLLPAIVSGVHKISPIISKIARFFQGMPKPMQSLIGNAAKLAIVLGPAALVLGKILTGVGKIRGGFAKLTGPIEAQGTQAGTAYSKSAASSASKEVESTSFRTKMGNAFSRLSGTFKSIGYSVLGVSLISGAANAIQQKGGEALKGKAFVEGLPGGTAVEGLLGIKSISDTQKYNAQLALMSIRGQRVADSLGHVATTGGDLNKIINNSIPDLIKSNYITAQQGAALEKVARSQFDYLNGLKDLRVGNITTWKDISKVVQSNIANIRNTVSLGSNKGRSEMAKNFQAAAVAVKHGMDQGLISTKTGMTKIRQLITKSLLVQGKDPMGFGKAWGNSVKSAEDITGSGLKKIEARLALMPKRARATAAQAMVWQLEELVKGGQLSQKAVDRFVSHLNGKWHDMAITGRKSTSQMAAGIASNFGIMGNAVASVISILAQNTNNALVQFGAKKLNIAVQKVGNILGFGKATGGYMDGPSRRDTIPAMLGAGEAVLNIHQQPAVEAGLAASQMMGIQPYGSLDELFASVQRPNYLAGGGFAAQQVTGPGPIGAIGGRDSRRIDRVAAKWLRKHLHGPYVWPFSKLSGYSPSRTDMGFDAGGSGPLLAIGDGTVIATSAPGWPGGGGNAIKLDRTPPGAPGPKSDTYYQYEHIISKLHPGQKVKAGDVVGTLLAGDPWSETGWAVSGGTTPLTPYNGAADGTAMPAGKSMTKWLADLQRHKHARGGFVGGITVKHAGASPAQLGTATAIMNAADQTNAPFKARVAAIMAATQENTMSPSNTFQVTSPKSGVSAGSGTYAQALAWFTKGFFGKGGGNALAGHVSDPGAIAQMVEGSAFPGAYEQWKSEAQNTVRAWGRRGGRAGKGGAPAKHPSITGHLTETVGPLAVSATPASSAGLPAGIQGLLSEPGLSYDQQLAIGQAAQSIAQGTTTTADDIAADKFVRDLESGKLHADLKALKAINAKLRKGGLTPKAQAALLSQRDTLLQEITGIKSDLAQPSTASTAVSDDLQAQRDAVLANTEAMKALADAIKTQNDFAKQVTSVSLGQAWKAMADLISGQIAGNLNSNNGAPTAAYAGLTRY